MVLAWWKWWVFKGSAHFWLCPALCVKTSKSHSCCAGQGHLTAPSSSWREEIMSQIISSSLRLFLWGFTDSSIFSHHCDQTPDMKQLKEVKVYFNLNLKFCVTPWRRRQAPASGPQPACDGRGQLDGVSSCLLPCGFWESNFGLGAQQQGPWLTASSCRPELGIQFWRNTVRHREVMTTGGLSTWSPCTRNQEAERRPEVGYKTSRFNCGPLPAEKLYLLHYKPSKTVTPAGEQVSTSWWGTVHIQILTGTRTAAAKVTNTSNNSRPSTADVQACRSETPLVINIRWKAFLSRQVWDQSPFILWHGETLLRGRGDPHQQRGSHYIKS